MDVDVDVVTLGDTEFLVVGRHYFNIMNISGISFAEEDNTRVTMISGEFDLTEEEGSALRSFLKEKAKTSWSTS